MNKQVFNFQVLDKQAEIYKESKQNLIDNSAKIRNTILTETKQEYEEVQEAINRLNKKIDILMERPDIKDAKENIEQSHKRMSISIEIAAKAFFKIRKFIYDKENLTIDQKKEYEKKVYKKILSKFLSQEEIDLFEKIIRQGNIVMAPKGNLNNLLIN